MAGTLFLMLSLAVLQIIVHSEKMTEMMISQITQNSQARETFKFLWEGSKDYPGYQNRDVNPYKIDGTGDVSRQDFRLRWVVDTVKTTKTSAFNVTCLASGSPVISCTTAGDVVSVDGYIDQFGSQTTNRSVTDTTPNNRTAEITFTVIDPQKVPHDGRKSQFTQDEYSETFWTIFTFNVDP